MNVSGASLVMSEPEDDQFQAKICLMRLLEDIEGGKIQMKLAVDYCQLNKQYSSELTYCLTEEFLAGSKAIKKIIVNLFNALLGIEKSVWPKCIKTRLKECLESMIEMYLKDDSSPSLAEILLKWTSSFKIECREDQMKRLREIAEQSVKRKAFNDIMEKDREAHKALKVQSWSRSVDEDPTEEFLSYYKRIPRLSDDDYDLIVKDYVNFCTINGRKIKMNQKASMTDSKKPRMERMKKTVFIFDIEDSFVYLDSFLLKDLNPPESLYQAAKHVDNLVTDLAVNYFFYKDFKHFQQPVIDYFCKYDDMSDLRHHDFRSDRLALKDPRSEDPEFYRERAWRSRRMAEYFKSPVFFQNPSLLEEFKVAYRRLDQECKQLNSLAASVFAVLSKKPNCEMYLVAPRSLSRLFAVCLALNLEQFFLASHIYSSLPHGRLWCLEDIKARLGPGFEGVLVGGHSDAGKDAERLGWRFFKVRNKKEMLEFVKTYQLVQSDQK